MHEAALAFALIESVAGDARMRGINRVDTLEVRLGEWSGVNPEALRFAFEVLRSGTVCESAGLDLECVPATGELTIVAYEGR